MQKTLLIVSMFVVVVVGRMGYLNSTTWDEKGLLSAAVDGYAEHLAVLRPLEFSFADLRQDA